ncbi:hypothetical protein [Methanoregula sp.]|uniref:hypothetical protein n=1 Tax=Methanoregula sp. TaxID=2052170 RepID=UPI003BAEAD1F
MDSPEWIRIVLGVVLLFVDAVRVCCHSNGDSSHHAGRTALPGFVINVAAALSPPG